MTRPFHTNAKTRAAAALPGATPLFDINRPIAGCARAARNVSRLAAFGTAILLFHHLRSSLVLAFALLARCVIVSIAIAKFLCAPSMFALTNSRRACSWGNPLHPLSVHAFCPAQCMQQGESPHLHVYVYAPIFFARRCAIYCADPAFEVAHRILHMSMGPEQLRIHEYKQKDCYRQ